ncbi:putative transporter [Deltaproteobacteria bacterium Smac51]|nr:putative transporter [Deltaproteobacteria bacterium Smac51]
MEWFWELWSGQGIASSLLKLVIVITVGLAIGKVKIKGLSLGVTWSLFVGIFFAHFGMKVSPELLSILKELGLIFFVYAVGMQVGPGFFATFKTGGISLNLFALAIAVLGCLVTYAIYLYTGTPIATMVGIMSGAVTNTPGLGAAQQANFQLTGLDNPDIAAGYAVAYPLAVVGTIMTMLFFYYIFKINTAQEEKEVAVSDEGNDRNTTRLLSLRVRNKALDGLKISEVHNLIRCDFVISRIRCADNTVRVVDGDTVLGLDNDIFVVTSADNAPTIVAFIGEETSVDWDEFNKQIISRNVIVTRPEINHKTLSQLRLRALGVNVTRIKRIGIEFIATPAFQLQMGDQLTVVGAERSIELAAEKLGNSLKRLNSPNLFQLFFGIALGIFIGSIPISIPGMSQPVKLGLAGGPLIIAILLSRFGLKLNIITYTTESANLMLRDVGIALFLASVGLSVGGNFMEVIVNGGYKWIGYGIMITVIPLLIIGFIARKVYRMNYFTLCGLMAGAMTDAPALAIVNEMSNNDIHSMSYATVYPMTMFLRVLFAQMMILTLA